MAYNYIEAMKEDVKEYINNEVNAEDYTDREALEEFLQDKLWTVDSVTGNASGSYTFNRYQAKEYVLQDTDGLKEALEEYGTTTEVIADKFLTEDWEWFDVTLRCWYLWQAIAEALDEIEDNLQFADDEK